MRNTIRTLLEDTVRYQTQGRHEAAEVTTREALKLFKQHFLTENDCKAQDLYQLAHPLLEAGQFDKALPLVREAYQLNPDHRHAFLGYLRATFCLDRYEEFWKLHEDRRRFLDNLIAYERIYGKEKMWNGIDSLKGKRVLVYGEGGAGDQIQFVRYLPWLKVRGCTIVFNCTAALAPLMQLHCIDEIVWPHPTTNSSGCGD